MSPSQRQCNQSSAPVLVRFSFNEACTVCRDSDTISVTFVMRRPYDTAIGPGVTKVKSLISRPHSPYQWIYLCVQGIKPQTNGLFAFLIKFGIQKPNSSKQWMSFCKLTNYKFWNVKGTWLPFSYSLSCNSKAKNKGAVYTQTQRHYHTLCWVKLKCRQQVWINV